MLTDTSLSPHAKLRSVPLDGVEWTDGFWAHKFEICRTAMVPNMWRLLEDPSVSHNVENFRIAAGRAPGTHSGPPFGDGDLYKWLEAASYTLGKTHDTALERTVDEAIELIAAVQRDDGYIFTKQAIESRRNPGSSQPLSDQLNFEVYNLGHLMTAACVHFRATSKRSLLDIAERSAAYLEKVFGEVKPENAKTAVCPSHYMGTIELYRTTRNRRYLELAKKLIGLRDLVQNGTDDNQDRIPLAEQRRAVGHAVRANYLYAGVADLYAETGDAALLDVLESCWQNVVFQKMYITGSCGALYDGVSPYGSSNYNEIQRTHQAYGREYELPNITAYNETCAAIGHILWNWRMLNLSAESRFADVLELTLYNGALSGVSLDGRKFFYANALRRHLELPFSLKWSRKREAYISSFCCPPNLVRTIAESTSYAYAVSRDCVHAILYGGSLARLALENGAKITLEQTTSYPWSGDIRIRIAGLAGNRSFAVNLRIPGWAERATVRINGLEVESAAQPGSFFTIEREWAEGDTIDLAIPMEVRLMEAHPLLEETRNHLAVKRGPIVYCVESADLPKEMPLSELFIPRDAEFTEEVLDLASDGEAPVRETILTLRTTMRRRRSPAGASWERQLYRPVRTGVLEEVPVRLIPYYAWDNRGFGEMSVWLPECCEAHG